MWSECIETLNPYESLKEAKKVENKKIYNDDVERIVNDPDRQKAINAFHEKRMAKRHRKMLMDACVYAAIAVTFGLLGCVGWMTTYIALPVCNIMGMYATFCFGRWFENRKCRG